VGGNFNVVLDSIERSTQKKVKVLGWQLKEWIKRIKLKNLTKMDQAHTFFHQNRKYSAVLNKWLFNLKLEQEIKVVGNL